MNTSRSRRLLFGALALAIVCIGSVPPLGAAGRLALKVDATAIDIPSIAQSFGFEPLGGGDRLILNPPPPNISPTDAKAPDDQVDD